ncbi:MAG: radical SAM protein [Ureaplasma sp.]|nr:radical SAM protein [Ureaplasma sp.]
MRKYIYVNSIRKNPSLCDGPGYRIVVFLQGCNIYCKGCQNPSTWKPMCNKKYDVKELAKILKDKAITNKITISGGEPLFQQDALIQLLLEFKKIDPHLDICLYTSYELDQVPKEILKNLTYIKTGRYIEELKDPSLTYYGSTNQKLIKLEDNNE